MAVDPEFINVANGKIARSKGPLIVAWIVVFCANLPLPLLYGVFLTEKGGRVGMAVAVLIMLTLGVWAVAWSRRGGLAVVTGGWVVAVSQFMPVLQVYAGVFSVSVVMGGDRGVASGLEDELGGFVATIMTGGILITIALGIGAALLKARAAFKRWDGERLAKPVKYELLDF